MRNVYIALCGAAFMLPLVGQAAVPETQSLSYAEKLMTDAKASHPKLLFVVVHANVTDKKNNVFQLPRSGSAIPQEAITSLQTGTPHHTIDPQRALYLVELPLQDVAGATIGTLGEVFSYNKGEDINRLNSEASAVQTYLRRHVTNAGNLLEPFPYDKGVSPNTAAQKIVDDMMAKHPDLQILAIHVPRPGESVSIILGSNIGRIGKKDTEDDMEVYRTGKPYLEIKAPGDRYEDILVLNDSHGTLIGTVAILLPFHKGADPVPVQRHAEAIRDEMQREIPSLSELFKEQ